MRIVESKQMVLVIPFRNGEVLCCRLDGYFEDAKQAKEWLLSWKTMVQRKLYKQNPHPTPANARMWIALVMANVMRAKSFTMEKGR